MTPNSESATRLAARASVYQAGAFDPSEAQTGEAVTVAGRTGYYYNIDGEHPVPAIAVRYAPDSWFLVRTDDQPPKARDTVLKVAAAVRFGVNRPLRFPIRFDYLPTGLRPCGGQDGLDPARIGTQPWDGGIELCDDLFGKSDNGASSTGEAISIHMTADPTAERPPKTNRIGGRPATTDTNLVLVDCTEFVLNINVKASHASRYGPAELQKIVESLTIRSVQDKSTWFTGTDALPTTS